MPVSFYFRSLIWDVEHQCLSHFFFFLDKNVFLTLLGDLLVIVNNVWLTGGIEEEDIFSGKDKKRDERRN